MKKLIYLIFIPLLMVGMGCSDDEKENNVLKGTKWKLEGYATSESSELKIMEPSDCEECYIIEFLTKNTWEGQGYLNFVGGSFKLNKERIEMEVSLSSFAEVELDEDLYLSLLRKTEQYYIANDKLYLYSDSKSNYLCYTSIKK